ncbi:MAG TPA: mandelate racemase/muconate lactonizing enzyme family protein [Xanthobacteraceae bacterium]|nr:mandelate racemase/muconate lactonizing enzyme family protein [Xanthobacteraceae bacterium]
MKIKTISTTLLQIPFQTGGPTQALGGQVWSTMAILLVRVDTDDGFTGWGEGFGHAVAPATKATLDTFVAGHFIGRDPTDIVGLTGEMLQKLHIFGRNGSVSYALSAIDIALWDIAGKRAGRPIHQLLGGARRQEMPAYASMLRYGEPALVGDIAARAAAEGYAFVKLHEIDTPQVAAARDAVGPNVEIMCDTNCPWTPARAIEMAKAFQPYRLHWLEEPVWPPEDHAGLAAVRKTGMTLAAGENAAGPLDFQQMFDVKAIDIAQPSVTKIGGISEMRKVIALADAAGVLVVPHCAYFGPGYLASLHVAATLTREAPLERLYVELEASPFGAWLEAPDGKVRVPSSPGLGCDPDPAIVKRYRVRPDGVTG